jgi:hypothetical protein
MSTAPRCARAAQLFLFVPRLIALKPRREVGPYWFLLASGKTTKCWTTRVARFFLVKRTKTGKNYQITLKFTTFPQNRPNRNEIGQHLPLQDPPKFTQFGNFRFENICTIWQPGRTHKKPCFASIRHSYSDRDPSPVFP